MRKRTGLVILAAVVIVLPRVTRLAAFTETVVIRDDTIFLDHGDGEPNFGPLAGVNLPQRQTELDLRPALVYIDYKPLDERLCVASLIAGRVETLEIASARYIQATQLDNAIFLVSTSGSSTERSTFVIDLDRCTGRQLARSDRIHCLRSVPERGKAMLVHCDLGIGEVRYLELDLATLRLTLDHTFKRADLGDTFAAVCPGTALSPDFQHVTYMAGQWWPPVGCQLTLMNLSTLQETVLDEDVDIVIAPISSAGGLPPLEWIDDEQIVYRHMPISDTNDPNFMMQLRGLCVFKRVDTATGKIIELSREFLRLGIGGGSLKLNPLNGELIYNGQSILDPNDGTLASAILPFSVLNELDPQRATVFLHDDLLHTADGAITSTLISASHEHLAYVLRSPDVERTATLFMKTADIAEPIEVASNSYAITPSGWVE